jgi:heptosyltransferase-2
MVRLAKLQDDNEWIEFALPPLNFEKKVDPKKIILAPGGNPSMQPGKSLRQWPLSYYVELAKKLLDKGYHVYIIGNKDDQYIEKAFKELPVISKVGKQTLGQCLELIASAYLVVTCDSGPMHLAILAKTLVFAIFGPTMPEEKLPLNQPEFIQRIRYFVNRSQLTCSPCYDGKYYAACNNPICVKQIYPQFIYDQILNYENCNST